MASMLSAIPDPFSQLEKIARVSLPTLVVHGSIDEISPVAMGKDLFEKSGSMYVCIHRILSRINQSINSSTR